MPPDGAVSIGVEGQDVRSEVVGRVEMERTGPQLQVPVALGPKGIVLVALAVQPIVDPVGVRSYAR